MPSRLVVSLSGVDRTNLDRCARFADELHANGVPVSILARSEVLSGTATWLAERAGKGDCPVLHGFPGSATLPGHEAGLRLIALSAQLEELGLRLSCFATRSAPHSTREALRRFGFRVCADVGAVHDLPGEVSYHGRLLELGRGGRGEQWRRTAAALAIGRAMRRPDALVRLAVDVADLARTGVPGLVRAMVGLAQQQGAEPITLRALGGAAPVRLRRSGTDAPDEAIWSQTA
jgi:predicted deacetylase